MPSGYPSSSEPHAPTPHALAAGLLAATSGDYRNAILILRQSLELLENAQDMKTRNEQRG